MRLDVYLVQEGYCQSRDRAKAFIAEGHCSVNGRVVTKPAYSVRQNDDVQLLAEDIPYVGRGGLKLEGALEAFDLHPEGTIALDVGVATGGFTDCLLQRGARKVYAVDVGKGQLADRLKHDDRLIFMPNKDARDLVTGDFPDQFDLIVVDVSFISVTKLLAALKTIGQPKTDYVFLIKPQFETGRPHSGVLKDEKLLQRTLKDVEKVFEEAGYVLVQTMDSPIRGKEGNREFLWHARLR